jgi:hypothetical protein
LALGFGVDLASLYNFTIDLLVIAESSLEILGVTPNGISHLSVGGANASEHEEH